MALAGDPDAVRTHEIDVAAPGQAVVIETETVVRSHSVRGLKLSKSIFIYHPQLTTELSPSIISTLRLKLIRSKANPTESLHEYFHLHSTVSLSKLANFSRKSTALSSGIIQFL